MKIGIDIDGVVAPTPDAWKCWLENVCRHQVRGSAFNYNLTKHFEPFLDILGIDGYDWWRQENLYDDIYPTIGCKDVLSEVSVKGCEIVFISALKGNHHKSKVNFIKKHFPFYDAFLGTKEKGYVRVDIMIDDRLENLYQFDETVLKILYNTPFEQTVPLRDDVIVADSWEDVRNILVYELEYRELCNIRAKHGVFS